MPVDAPDLAARDTAKLKKDGWRFMEIDEAVVQDHSFIEFIGRIAPDLPVEVASYSPSLIMADHATTEQHLGSRSDAGVHGAMSWRSSDGRSIGAFSDFCGINSLDF